MLYYDIEHISVSAWFREAPCNKAVRFSWDELIPLTIRGRPFSADGGKRKKKQNTQAKHVNVKQTEDSQIENCKADRG